MADDDGFLARWSRRKSRQRQGLPLAEPAPPEPASEAWPVVAATARAPAPPALASTPPTEPVATPAAEPPPTLAEAAALAPGAEVRRFVARGVDPAVKNAALKRLFADPQFNVMDGLDVYIDDYGRPDPLPAAMLRQLAQSRMLGLFDDEPPPPVTAPTTAAPLPEPPPDDNADLRLQPHDAAGPADAAPGPGADAGRQP